MKTKIARQIAKSAFNGTVYPVYILRAAARQLGRPVIVKTSVGRFTYFPKGMKGEFKVATLFRPIYISDMIVRAGDDLSIFKDRNGYVCDLDVKAGEHRLDVSGGSSIQGTSVTVANLARVLRMRVPFNFNGAEIVASPSSLAINLYNEWVAEMERQRQKYLASDEYKQKLVEQEADRIRDQGIIDRLLSTLEEAVKDRETLLMWLAEFVVHADNSRLVIDLATVNAKLRAAGYVSRAWVGDKALISECKVKEAEYIIGQAMSCIDNGMPPHPILNTFVKRYLGEEPYPNDEAEESEVEETACVVG